MLLCTVSRAMDMNYVKLFTYLFSRKRNPKRPAIKSIINQRSPVIVSLLPSPKEKSQYLFKPHRLDQDKTIDSCDIEALVDELSAALSSK